MNPFNDRPTQTRAPATGWANIAPWTIPQEPDATATRVESSHPISTNDAQESCCAASWGY